MIHLIYRKSSKVVAVDFIFIMDKSDTNPIDYVYKCMFSVKTEHVPYRVMCKYSFYNQSNGGLNKKSFGISFFVLSQFYRIINQRSGNLWFLVYITSIDVFEDMY